MAIENGPVEIVDFPIKNGDFPLQNVSSPDGNFQIIPALGFLGFLGCPCQGSSSQFGRPVAPQSDTNGKSYGKSYPLVMTNVAMENHHF